jgi:hypothetical protein
MCSAHMPVSDPVYFMCGSLGTEDGGGVGWSLDRFPLLVQASLLQPAAVYCTTLPTTNTCLVSVYGLASPTASVLCDGDAVRNSLRIIICVVLLLLTQTLHTCVQHCLVCFASVFGLF